MKNIKDYNLEELKQELISLGEKPYRAEQIFNWLYREKVKNIDDMTNLSLDLRNKLKENYTMCNFEILKKLSTFFKMFILIFYLCSKLLKKITY